MEHGALATQVRERSETDARQGRKRSGGAWDVAGEEKKGPRCHWDTREELREMIRRVPLTPTRPLQVRGIVAASRTLAPSQDPSQRNPLRASVSPDWESPLVHQHLNVKIRQALEGRIIMAWRHPNSGGRRSMEDMSRGLRIKKEKKGGGVLRMGKKGPSMSRPEK